MEMIPFNKPYLSGKETEYMVDAVNTGKISGNGKYTKLCQQFFEDKYGFNRCLLTTSCTDALEMAAILANIQPGDEVILPSYTFVSSANAFVLRGAKIVFADSYPNHPNIDHTKLEGLISDKTKAIVVVHYSGVACEMDAIMDIAKKHNLIVVEDAAQAVDSYYKSKPLGGIGHLATFSFHETKNIISGEGGMLVINDDRFTKRAEIIWEKGTNRTAFFRGETDKYSWMDIGSSFLPPETVSSFLYAQLENLEDIQRKRIHIWEWYYNSFKPLADKGLVKLPELLDHATNNAHIFYLVLPDLDTRSRFITHLKANKVHAVFHYIALHTSPFMEENENRSALTHAEDFTDRLVRLPLFYELTDADLAYICEQVHAFFNT